MTSGYCDKNESMVCTCSVVYMRAGIGSDRLVVCLSEYLDTLTYCILYTEYAGPEISVNSRIASLFSRQIANVNAGPILALQFMGAKRYFRCCSLNIGLMYK